MRLNNKQKLSFFSKKGLFTLGVLMLSGAIAHGQTIPGYSYKLTCGQVLSDSQSKLETVRKVLPATAWPEGAKQNFSFFELNFLNLIDIEDAAKKQLSNVQTYGNYAKPKYQLDGIARLFKKHKPMLAFGIEISNLKLLRDYDNEFIGDQYEEFLIEGNDPRGIDVGFLVRKDLPLDVEVQSHRNLIKEETRETIYSRDLPAYILREKNQDKPLLVILGTHFKSQRSVDGDPNGLHKRSLQVQATAVLIEDYRKQFPDTPIMLAGDFNNDVRYAKEFKPLRDIGMIDSFDMAIDGTELDKRTTHFYFPHDGKPSTSQLDAIWIQKDSVSTINIKSAKILSHINPQGGNYPDPKSFQQRELLPSDHKPTLLIMEFGKAK